MRVEAVTPAERVEELVAEHGTLMAASKATGIDLGLLSNIRHGRRRPIQGKTLEKLGLKIAYTKG